MENKSSLYKQNYELRKENTILKSKIKKLNMDFSAANCKIKNLESKYNSYVEKEQQRIEKIITDAVNEVTTKLKKEYEEVIDGLNAKITKLEKRLNTNSSNSGIPTSKDRIETYIPNCREKSKNKIGAPKGHKVHKLEYFKDEEITQIVEHKLDKCPNCGGKLKEMNIVKSDIIDVRISVIKTRNNIHNYRCEDCKKRISANNKLPRGVSYGDNINATALSLLNESNVAYNKITKHISGISNKEIMMTEGYLVKLQKKSSKKLDIFINDLKEKILKLKNVYWDDTVVKLQVNNQKEFENKDSKTSLNKVKNGIIRFYGDDKYALLIGHSKKDKCSIDEDGILANLPSDCTCMHDHVLLNYNEEYEYKNAECNAHVLRYLKGVKDNLHEHTWQDKMSDLLKNLNDEKKKLLSNKITFFSNDKIEEVYNQYDSIIKLGYEENEQTPDYHFYKDEELKLIKRLSSFKDNHLLFIKDFTVGFTNNTSEKGLRQCKRKLTTSFMFKNLNTLRDYAKIISYLETCYRNGITRFDALKRLIDNNAYTIEEISNMSNVV